MLNAIVAASLRYKGLVLVAFAVVIGLGVQAFRQVPVDAFPDVTPIQVSVGAQPARDHRRRRPWSVRCRPVAARLEQPVVQRRALRACRHHRPRPLVVDRIVERPWEVVERAGLFRLSDQHTGRVDPVRRTRHRRRVIDQPCRVWGNT